MKIYYIYNIDKYTYMYLVGLKNAWDVFHFFNIELQKSAQLPCFMFLTCDRSVLCTFPAPFFIRFLI